MSATSKKKKMKETYLTQYGSLTSERWRWLVGMLNQRVMTVVVGCEDKNGNLASTIKKKVKRRERKNNDRSALWKGNRSGKGGGEEVMLLPPVSRGIL